MNPIKKVIDLPWWADLLLWIVNILPLPVWVKAVINLIKKIIETIPDPTERETAKKELNEAAKLSLKKKDDAPLKDFIIKRAMASSVNKSPVDWAR